MDSVTASPNVPEIGILAPAAGERWENSREQTVSWVGNDPDGDTLQYSVFYAQGGTENWHVLEVGLTDTQLTFDPAFIQGGAGVRRRVIANDGFHSGDAIVGPIEVIQSPRIEVRTMPLDLGETIVGRPIVGAVTVRNSGSGPLEIQALKSDSPLFEILPVNLPLTVSAGSRRDILLRFAPDTLGMHTATLTIESNSTEQSELPVPISGIGADGQTPRLLVASETIGFFGVAAGATQAFPLAIENGSRVDLEINWEFAGAGAFSVVAESSAFTLAGRESSFISVTFTPETTGEFEGTLTIRSNDPNRPEIAIPVIGSSFAPPPMPAFTAAGIVSAADFAGDRFAAEMWVAVFGENLADKLWIPTGGLPTSLGGTTVTVTDSAGSRRSAKLQFVAPNRLNFLIPKRTALGPATVLVTNAQGEAASAEVPIESVAPGLFSANSSGRGPAAATFLRVAADDVRTEGLTFATDTAERPNIPIALNAGVDQVFLSFFGTGFRFQSSVSASIDGVELPVLGAVAQGQFDGLDQAVVGPLPAALAGRGDVEVRFIFDGFSANPVTVNIQ